jgi:septum formation protein
VPRSSSSNILLASGSPRRREILQSAGFRFRRVATPEVEEVGEGKPAQVVRVNARRKCRAAAEGLEPSPRDVVLGADTVVAIDAQVLGKPEDRADAARMLRALSGRWHRVVTGIWLRGPGGDEVGVVTTTRVHVAPLASSWIQGYLSSGEADDKAGAYGIQGRMGVHVDRISGCYFNVVGLSPAALRRGLDRIGLHADEFLRTSAEA